MLKKLSFSVGVFLYWKKLEEEKNGISSHLVPLGQEDRQQEEEGAYPEDQGAGDEEELREAGGVMVIALGGQVLEK